MRIIERDLTRPELDRVHAGFDEHGRLHGNPVQPRTRHTFVAMDNGGFIGCATGLRDNRWYHLTDLWIEAAFRGRGIGRQLLRNWEDRTAADGVMDAYTWTAGFQAADFYRKQGWAVFAELPA